MTQQEILNSPFDIDTHKKHFVDYLEVVIFPDGTIEYAIPSHQEKLIFVATQKLGVSREHLYNMCPQKYMFDVCTWLCEITNCVSVWNDFYRGTPNAAQKKSLQNLKDHALYSGNI